MSRNVTALDPIVNAALHDALTVGRSVGAIGPGPLAEHVRHALGYLIGANLHETAARTAIDLGSGAGVPGLPLALLTPDVHWYFVESWERRAVLLRRQVRHLGLDDHVGVLAQRAEDTGRGPLRGTADLVTARAFGPAGVTLECAGPLLRLGGLAILSVRAEDPPWPEWSLARLGLGEQRTWCLGRFVYRAVRAVTNCDDQYPRRAGRPERDPLF